MMDDSKKYSDLTGKIIGCATEVYRTIGKGFQEVIYQRALELELQIADISFKSEFDLPILYKGKSVGNHRVDFLINDLICVEIKAVTDLESLHMSQTKIHLEAFNQEIGLLINFGAKSLQIKRVINSKFKDPGKEVATENMYRRKRIIPDNTETVSRI